MENSLIGLIGQGRIFHSVNAHLNHLHQHVQELTLENLRDRISGCTIIVYCSDNWSPQTILEVNRLCLQEQRAFLPVYTQFNTGIVGPCVLPSEAGCAFCAELRKFTTTSNDDDLKLLHQHIFEKQDGEIGQPWLHTLSLDVLSHLAVEELLAYLQNPARLRTHLALLALSLDTLASHRHAILPSSECTECWKPIEDTIDRAHITLQSRLKLDPVTYRTRHLGSDLEQIFSAFVDPRTGMIPEVRVRDEKLLPTASARLQVMQQHVMYGTGYGLQPRQNKIVALAEALERYAGWSPRGKRALVHASYRQLGERALDPVTLGLHTQEQYALPDYRLVPYHEDLMCNWVWGYSFRRQCPILVPERCVYYSRYLETDDNPSFLYEISNGCALGSCLEEAIFHGIIEIIERDAFLLTWYAQLDLPHLDLSSATDPRLRLLIEHIEYRSGYMLYAFNATLDHAIPCFWILAVDEQNRSDWPKARCESAAGPNPEQALYKGLHELASSISRKALPSYLERRPALQEMLADSHKVREMQDHSALYYLPEAFKRLHFLYHSQRRQTFQEAFANEPQQLLTSLDLRDNLTYLINHYLQAGLDIVIVEQTAPEHTAASFRCVKVLMPGTLSMTFGHDYRRVSGVPRLYQVPFTQGYRKKILTAADLNFYPHPFP